MLIIHARVHSLYFAMCAFLSTCFSLRLFSCVFPFVLQWFKNEFVGRHNDHIVRWEYGVHMYGSISSTGKSKSTSNNISLHAAHPELMSTNCSRPKPGYAHWEQNKDDTNKMRKKTVLVLLLLIPLHKRRKIHLLCTFVVSLMLLCAASHDRRWLIYLFNCYCVENARATAPSVQHYQSQSQDRKRTHSHHSIHPYMRPISRTRLTFVHLAYFTSMFCARNWSHSYTHRDVVYKHHTYYIYMAKHTVEGEKRISFCRMQNCQRLQKPFWMVYYSFRWAMLEAIELCVRRASIAQRIIIVLRKLHWRARARAILTNRLYVNAGQTSAGCMCVRTESRFLSRLTMNERPGRHMLVTNRYIRLYATVCHFVISFWRFDFYRYTTTLDCHTVDVEVDVSHLFFCTLIRIAMHTIIRCLFVVDFFLFFYFYSYLLLVVDTTRSGGKYSALHPVYKLQLQKFNFCI